VDFNAFVHVVLNLQIFNFGHEKTAVLNCGKTSPYVFASERFPAYFPKKNNFVPKFAGKSFIIPVLS
jgi:citrate lyase synthetase